MDIYEYIHTINDIYNIRFRVFDGTSRRCIFNKKNVGCDYEVILDLQEMHGLDTYDVESVDIFYAGDEQCIVIELNIMVDEEDVDKFEEVL